MSKLLGRYHFAGPYKCRPLNVYNEESFAVHTAVRKFSNTIANRLKGSAYVGDWILIKESPHDYEWTYKIAVVRRDPKFPDRCRFPQSFQGTVRYTLV